MSVLIELLCNIFTSVISLLPASPFLIMLRKIEDIPVLSIINWFIPFDVCLTFLEIWLAVVASYLVVRNMDKILDMFSRFKNLF